MQEEIDDFMNKFGVLQCKGLPSPLVINEKLMTQIDYVDKLAKYADNQASSSSSAAAPKAIPTGRVLFDSLENLFYVEHEIKHLFQVQPNSSNTPRLMRSSEKFKGIEYHRKNGG